MNGVYYISADGIAKLREELEHREKVLRKEIAEKIGTAKDQGDLSENFEYQESKEQQAQNETRIIEIRDILSRSIVTEKGSNHAEIQIGSTFTVKLSNGDTKDFALVGSTEADPIAGRISNDSPLGKAFLGKGAGDIVDIEVPSGTVRYEIISVA